LKYKIKDFYYRVKVYLANTSWIMAEKLLSMGGAFVITLFVARYLGPEQFGVFSYALSLVALFGVAGHVGLSGLVVHKLVKSPEETHEIMGTSLALKGGGYIVGLILIIAYVVFTENVESDVFWLVLILSTTLLLQPINILDFWFQSQLQAKYTAITKTTALLVTALFKALLIFCGANLILFAFANVLQALLVAIGLFTFYYYKSEIGYGKWRVSAVRAKELVSQGWMVFLGSIFAVIYLKVDQVMLRWLIGTEEVGIYAVAASLSEAWYFVPAAIVTSFFPKLIKLKEDTPTQFNKRLQQLFDLLFIVALSVAVMVSLVAQPVVNIMFGDSYASAASILVVHIWAAIFVFLRAAFRNWMFIENALIFSLITQGLGALVNVALNYCFIPIYGGLGAAYATLASYAVASYLALLLYPKTRIIFWMMTKSFFAPFRLAVNIIKN
jgi:O-antigen/teichoic acid export membrane protein